MKSPQKSPQMERFVNEQRQTFLEKLSGMVETVPDAAEMLGVSRQRVHQLIERGDLVAQKIGKNVFVDSLSLQSRLDTFGRKVVRPEPE